MASCDRSVRRTISSIDIGVHDGQVVVEVIADGGDARAVHVGAGQDHLGHADGEVTVAAGPGLHVAVAVADGLRQRGIDHDGARAARAAPP